MSIFSSISNFFRKEKVASYCAKGEEFLVNGQYEDALEMYNKAAEIQPDITDVNYYLNRGAAKQCLKDKKGAMRDYQKVLSLDANHKDACYNIATLLAAEEKNELAISYLEKVINIDPNDLSAIRSYAIVSEEISDYSGALELWLKYIEMNGSQEPNLTFRDGDVQSLLESTNDYYFKQAHAVVSVGICYKKLGDNPRALEELTSAKGLIEIFKESLNELVEGGIESEGLNELMKKVEWELAQLK